MEVADGDGGDAAATVDKAGTACPASAMLEETSWVDDEPVVCAVDNETIWLDWDDGDMDRDEERPRAVRRAKSRCPRLGFSGVGKLPLILGTLI